MASDDAIECVSGKLPAVPVDVAGEEHLPSREGVSESCRGRLAVPIDPPKAAGPVFDRFKFLKGIELACRSCGAARSAIVVVNWYDDEPASSLIFISPASVNVASSSSTIVPSLLSLS